MTTDTVKAGPGFFSSAKSLLTRVTSHLLSEHSMEEGRAGHGRGADADGSSGDGSSNNVFLVGNGGGSEDGGLFDHPVSKH